VDSYREHPGEFEAASAVGDDQAYAPDVSAIGTDERRMHVRAYNYWASLLDGRDYPSVEDLEPGDLADFAPHSVLLDFTSGRDNPATSFIGEALRAECGLDAQVQSIADVPSRSLLSRLTDHYMQIIANRAPVGFEAEFANQHGVPIRYRGILMPLSSDGDTIDFIYGVINWKTLDEAGKVPFQPQADLDEIEDPRFGADEDPRFGADDEPEAIELPEDSGLGDRLWAARENAEAAKAADGRSRRALYRALSHAYDFALAGRDDPQGYAELLEESGVKPQTRSPMTAVAKLVFGVDYDKARLTEFAAALAYADRQQVAVGGFLALVEAQAGGLKALVAAERQARRPGPRAESTLDAARSRLRHAEPLQTIASDEEFALVLTRLAGDGTHQVVAMVDDRALIERAIRRASA
jgi:hypothetical protein